MSSRTHSPAPLHTALPTPRVPGTRFLGVRRGAEVRHLQKERRSASASVQKARLQAREWAARNVATSLPASRPAGCQPHGRDFSQVRHLTGAPRRGLGKVSVALQVGGGELAPQGHCVGQRVFAVREAPLAPQGHCVGQRVFAVREAPLAPQGHCVGRRVFAVREAPLAPQGHCVRRPVFAVRSPTSSPAGTLREATCICGAQPHF